MGSESEKDVGVLEAPQASAKNLAPQGRKRQRSPQSAGLWLEKRIAMSMGALDEAGEDKALRDALDDYIGMKKKYESTIDRYGETKRVMEAFILYLREQGETASLAAVEGFLRYVGK